MPTLDINGNTLVKCISEKGETSVTLPSGIAVIGKDALCGLKNIRIANGVAVAWYLPERKARLLFGVPCLGNVARCLCAGIAYSHCSGKHGGIFKEFSSRCHIHKVCLRLVISAKISLNFLSQPVTCRRSSAYFANFATKT